MRCPNQLPLQEKQRLLKDCLFHRSQKSIRDSLKYCFADASIDYMQFLEKCRKAEEEGKVGQAKAKVKVKAAAATLPPTKDDELSRQLKYQQHQIDALAGQVKLSGKSHTTLLKGGQDWGPLLWERDLWDKNFWYIGRRFLEEGSALSVKSHSPVKIRNSQQGQGVNRTNKQYQCWQCGEVGHLKGDCPTLKGKGLSQRGVHEWPSATENAFPT